jgi:ribosomal subunit interface protein
MFVEGVSVSEQEKLYIDTKLEKVEKLLRKYDRSDELKCEVEIEQDKRGVWRLEIMIQTPHNLYRAEKANHVLTEAMDETEEALKKQIQRDKERLKDLAYRGAMSIKKKVTIDQQARF